LERTFTNVSGSALPATAFWSIGHPFIEGEVPSGSIVTGTVGGVSVPVQGVGSITHADGSLAWTELLVDLSGISLAAAASSDLVLTSTAGSWSTTTARTNADWTGLVDTVELTNMTTTGTSGNNMDKAGTYTAAFDAGGTNTITITGQGPRGLKVLVRAAFVNTGSTHRFLQAVMEYWVCQKADTSLGPVRSRGPFIENTLMDLTDPSRFNFDMTWKRGGAAQRTRVGVELHCGAIAAGCRVDGQGDWSTNEPSLVVTQDYNLVRATKKIPPFKTGLVYTQAAEWACTISTSTGIVTSTGNMTAIFGANSTAFPTAIDFRGTVLPSGTGFADGNVYWADFIDANTFQLYDTLPNAIAGGATGKLVPTGAGTSVFVRLCCGPLARASICRDLGATGNRDDIGLLTEWSSAMLVKNDQAAQRWARVSAYGMGAIGRAWRNSATGKIPGLLPTAQLPAGLGTGLETAFALGGSCSTQIGAGTGTFTGGGGQFTQSFTPNTSHTPAPIFATWLMEGGDYLREMLYFAGNAGILQKSFLANRNRQVGGTGTTYYALVITEGGLNLRIAFWALRDIAYAAFVAPDGSDEKAYLIQVLKNILDWYVADRAAKGTNYQTMGFYVFDADIPSTRRDLTIMSNYMSWYAAATLGYTGMLLGDDPDLATPLNTFLSNFCDTWMANIYSTFCPFFGTGYEYGPLFTESDYAASWDDVGNVPGSNTSYAFATDGTITWSGSDALFTLVDGDHFYAYDRLTQSGVAATTPPAELTQGRRYYVRDLNIGAKTFKIATTPGGTAITYATSPSGVGGVWHDTSCPSSGVAGSADNASATDGYVANAIAAMALSSVALGGAANSDAAYTAAMAKFTGDFDDGVGWALQNTA
jgi:hypothetical protein